MLYFTLFQSTPFETSTSAYNNSFLSNLGDWGWGQRTRKMKKDLHLLMATCKQVITIHFLLTFNNNCSLIRISCFFLKLNLHREPAQNIVDKTLVFPLSLTNWSDIWDRKVNNTSTECYSKHVAIIGFCNVLFIFFYNPDT